MGTVSSAEDLPEVPDIHVRHAGAPQDASASSSFQESHGSFSSSSKINHLEAFEKERVFAKEKKRKGRKLNIPVTWARRSVSYRLFGVLRHAERADMLGSRLDGETWTMSEESKEFPIDPPLSDLGRQEATRVAKTVRAFADRTGGELHVVVSSPYLRCVQTAVQVCKQLGPSTKLLLDHSLGEVFGHCVLGDQKPATTWHSSSYLVRYARGHGVRIVKQVCGKVPVWPETLRMARMRYASTFLSYLRRAEICRRNFVLVSHADCIASVLALIPSQAGRSVESVSTAASLLGSLTDRRSLKCSSRAVDEEAASDESDPARSHQKVSWAVELDGIQMGPRWRNGDTASRAAKRALQSNGNIHLTSFLEELLGGLSQEPLGDRSPKGDKPEVSQETSDPSSFLSPSTSEAPDAASCCSSSTMLFGASETGSEYDMSPTSPNTAGDFEILKPHSFCGAESIQRPNGNVSHSSAAEMVRRRFLSTGNLTPGRGSSATRSSSAGVKLQGCNGSAIMARRQKMSTS